MPQQTISRLVNSMRRRCQAVIDKKALREQWLMDGLSQQSQEEQEAMKLQAQDEQEQSDQLQSNIHRIEKEIEALETQELNISANEEVILKRLKEVEKTAEDIIKVDMNLITCLPSSKCSLLSLSSAMFAMEISVEHDMRTGESQVDRGVKVYDDGCKSVYALHQMAVEELLRQATDKKVPSEVQYHKPVYSASYTGTSRPPTPKTPSKTPTHTPLPAPAPSSQDCTQKWDSKPWRGKPAQPRARKSENPNSADSNRQSPFYPESEASLNLIYSLSEDLESEPVTMIFMGYHNAEDDDEEEDIQAELVIIGNSDDDDDDDDGDGKNGKKDNGGDEFLSYHPEGYKSKVFQPKSV
uniref:Palmdelphin n=1 Tax=Myripristis murdjan TaxID=586833 RepID=A0A667X5X7_9TELE